MDYRQYLSPEQLDAIYAQDKQANSSAMGALEALAALGSGAVAEPAAGLFGLLGLAATQDPSAAARGVEVARDYLTYQPRTDAGRTSVANVSEALAPIGEMLQGAQTGAGDYVYENTNSPLLGALTQALVGGAPDIAGGLLGTKVLPKGKRYSIGDIGGQASKAGGKQRGIFASVKAKTADLDALARAESMADSGASMRDIYDATGWFQAKDGNWNFYIPDKDMRFTPENLPRVEDYRAGLLSDAIDHPLAKEAYPELFESVNFVDYPFSGKSVGQFSPAVKFSWTDDIPPSITLWNDSSPFAASKRRVAAHELQHAIDDFEGGQSGAPINIPVDEVKASPIYKEWEALQPTREEINRLRNSDAYKKDLAASNRDFDAVDERINAILDDDSMPYEQQQGLINQLLADFDSKRAKNYPTLAKVDEISLSIPEYLRKEPTSKDVYRSVSGEAKARAVESLLDMLPSDVKYPWEYEDLPRNVQYVRLK